MLLILKEPSPCDLIFMIFTPSCSSISSSLSSLSWVGDRIGFVVFFDRLVLSLGELKVSDCILGVCGGDLLLLDSDLMSLLSS
jgi:hypothetical protein